MKNKKVEEFSMLQYVITNHNRREVLVSAKYDEKFHIVRIKVKLRKKPLKK